MTLITDIAKYKSVLYRAAFRYTKHKEIAEDLVQETFLKACNNWDKFDGKDLKNWLFKILMNTCNDWNRSNKNSPLVFIEDYDIVAIDDYEKETELTKDINNAIDSLPDLYKTTATLCFLKNVTNYAELAKLVGVSVGTIKKRLHESRKILRNKLKNYCRREK